MAINLKYDYRFMTSVKVGHHGFNLAELKSLTGELKKANLKLQDGQDPNLGFYQLPNELKTAKELKILAKRLSGQFNNLLVIGIGGSDLGARAIYQALAGDYALQAESRPGKMKIYFCGDTTDSQPLEDLLKILDLSKTAFYVVSKSGDTIEPLSAFLYLREKLIKKVGLENHRQHIIVTTNSDKGALLDIAKKEGYLLLPHAKVGGRYSVLSVNGLLPLACAGFNPEQILAGAQQLAKNSQSNHCLNNLPFLFSALQYLAYIKRGQSISVLMPYNYYLNKFGFWFRQLWGESLADRLNQQKQKVNTGITPIAALGPTDQHSQIQLYIEGPYNKIITFITVEKSGDLKVPVYDHPQIKFLGNKKFADLLKIEQKATAVSLMKNQRPNGTIILPEINEFYLGQLFFFFETAAYYLGELLKVNVFDQPGVEQSKRYMLGLLGKAGYEKDKKEILNS